MYSITSKFLQQESFRQKAHSGIDFGMENFTPLRSIQDGVVSKVVDYGNENIGKGVLVQWQDGKTAIYGHMSKISVHEGDRVSAGDLLGYSGNSGHVVGQNGQNGYHLHFGVKSADGSFIDPSPYIDSIQNMNTGGFEKLVTRVPVTDSVPDLFQLNASMYQDFFAQLKFHVVHMMSSIDYTMLMKNLQHLFQFFFS